MLQLILLLYKELQYIYKGIGAYGTVFKAVHKTTGKVYALKQIFKKQLRDQKMISQANNQIKILQKLRHPNIIKMYGHFQQEDSIYIVLQYASKGTLYKLLQQKGKLSEVTVRKIMSQVIDALCQLHSHSVIHRDIKPQNILLNNSMSAKLADFGWSNYQKKARKTYCGTYDYLAPQMIDNLGHDHRLDIWCTGVLTYQLLTGKPPFTPEGNDIDPRQRQIILQNNIRNLKINFPQQMSQQARQFIGNQLKINPGQRMTLAELKNHEFILGNKMNRYKIQVLQEQKIDYESLLKQNKTLKQRIQSLKNQLKQRSGISQQQIQKQQLMLTCKRKDQLIQKYMKQNKELIHQKQSILNQLNHYKLQLSNNNQQIQKYKHFLQKSQSKISSLQSNQSYQQSQLQLSKLQSKVTQLLQTQNILLQEFKSKTTSQKSLLLLTKQNQLLKIQLNKSKSSIQKQIRQSIVQQYQHQIQSIKLQHAQQQISHVHPQSSNSSSLNSLKQSLQQINQQNQDLKQLVSSLTSKLNT